jgi:hypothetical protein
MPDEPEVPRYPIDKRNEVQINLGIASITIKSEEPLNEIIEKAGNIVKRIKQKPSMGSEYE